VPLGCFKFACKLVHLFAVVSYAARRQVGIPICRSGLLWNNLFCFARQTASDNLNKEQQTIRSTQAVTRLTGNS